jgi:hypothetical protein
MLRLSKHLYYAARGTILVAQWRCFGKRSMTVFYPKPARLRGHYS